MEYCIDGRIRVIRPISARDQLLADYGVEYDRVWVKLGTRIEARWKGKWYSGTIAGSKTPIIWIVDQASQEVVAVQFDAQSDQLVGFGYRNMNNDAITVEKSRQ